MTNQATARANANIAFIKYWGNKDENLRLPVNASLSMNLDGLYTETTVKWDPSLTEDILILNGQEQFGKPLQRVSNHLTKIRNRLSDINSKAIVTSHNNFPMGAGIASSAASFAALTFAAVQATHHKDITEQELSSLARLGSGSASRSIPTGFVEWHEGKDHKTSFAETIAPPEYWDLVDVIAVISKDHKEVGSTEGHQSANTSDLQSARVYHAMQRVINCKRAILERDFQSFAEIVEEDSNLMHAVMMTSRPPIFYWQPTSIKIMRLVTRWRNEGLEVCYTLDAGPNVHCICTRSSSSIVISRLQEMAEVIDIKIAGPGKGAHLIIT